MCVEIIDNDLIDIVSLIIRTINEPCASFTSHVSATIPPDLVGDYTDQLLELTRRNQQTVDSDRLPSLHTVDLGQSRALDEDESHHLYNLFMLTGGVTGVLADNSISGFADTNHRIYHFTPEGLSFDIVDRTLQTTVDSYQADLTALEDTLPSLPTLVLNGWGLMQSSSLESSATFNTYENFLYDGDSALLDTTLFIHDHRHILVLQTAGTNVRLRTKGTVDHFTGGTFTIFPNDNTFPARITQNGNFILITKGPRWAVLNENFKIVNSGVNSFPCWDVVPFTFSGLPGFVLATGGSPTNLTAGVAAGGELVFISAEGKITVQAYGLSAPTALYRDGSSIYVGVALGGSNIRWECFNSSFRRTKEGTVTTSVANASIGSFFVHNGTLYGLLVSAIGGVNFTPRILDLEKSAEIVFTSASILSPATWIPHTKLLNAEVPVFDMRNAQTGAEIIPNEYFSCAGLEPPSSTYRDSSRYWVLSYDNDFDFLPLRVAASGAYNLGNAGVVDGAIIVQSGNSSYRLKLISQDNKVLPNIRFIRFQTLKEYPSPFTFTPSPDSNTYLHKDGLRYTIPSLSSYPTLTFDTIDRNDTLYALQQVTRSNLTDLRGTWNFNTVAASNPVASALNNIIQLPTSPTVTALFDAVTISGNNYLIPKASKVFNAEPAKCNELYDADRAWTNRRYFTKRLSTFDCGIVLYTDDAVRFVEVFLPSAQLSAIEWNNDLTADSATITAPRYDSSSTGEYVFSASGTAEFPDFFEPMTNSQVDILSFGSTFLTRQDNLEAFYAEGINRIFTGMVESLSSNDATVELKLIGSIETLGAPVKDTLSVTCPYVFGGRRCGVSLTKTVGVVTTGGNKSIVVNFGASLPLPLDRYIQGTVKLASNGFQNIEIDLVSVVLISGTTYRLTFYAALTEAVTSGTLVTLANGCVKTMERCNQYNNLARGRMLPYVQGGRVFTASGQINDGV